MAATVSTVGTVHGFSQNPGMGFANDLFLFAPELALVTHKPRAASAYAVGSLRLACKFS